MLRNLIDVDAAMYASRLSMSAAWSVANRCIDTVRGRHVGVPSNDQPCTDRSLAQHLEVEWEYPIVVVGNVAYDCVGKLINLLFATSPRREMPSGRRVTGPVVTPE